MSYWGLKRWNTRTHAHTHAHASRRQLKIKFLDVLDYSEYSDTNISKFFFHKSIASSVKKQKACESRFSYCSLTDFTKFFLWGSILFDFGFLTEQASWIRQIFKIWCHNKKIIKFKFVQNLKVSLYAKFIFKNYVKTIKMFFFKHFTCFAWKIRKNSLFFGRLKLHDSLSILYWYRYNIVAVVREN